MESHPDNRSGSEATRNPVDPLAPHNPPCENFMCVQCYPKAPDIFAKAHGVAPNRFDPYEALDTILAQAHCAEDEYHMEKAIAAAHALRAYITGMER